MKILESLKSRKFLAAFLVNPLIVWANRKFNLGLTPADLACIVAGIVGWIGVEGFMDAKGIEKNGVPHAPPADGAGPAPEVK